MIEVTRKKGMSLIILDILRDNRLHGYGIGEKIEELYGIERPSSGLIYPLLLSLEKRNLIRVYERGTRDKKIYEITSAGIKYLEEHKEEVERRKKFLRKIGEFWRMGGHEMVESIKLLIKNIDSLSNDEKKEIEKTLRDCAKRIRFIVEFGE